MKAHFALMACLAAVVALAPYAVGNSEPSPDPLNRYGSLYSHARPPASYQADTPMVTVETASAAVVNYECGDRGKWPHPPNTTIMACARGKRIMMPNPCAYRRDPYADLLCHELAHVNGWPADHPAN